LKTLPETDFLTSAKTGAGDNPTKEIPGNAVGVRAGESIQDAIDNNRGKQATIVLAKGVHKLEAPLKMYSGLTLAGYGKESILFLAPQVHAETIVCGDDSLSDATFRDFLIEGAATVVTNNDPNHDRRNREYMSAPSREGIVLRSEKGGVMKNILFENVTIQNFTKNGLLIVGASNIRIHRCDFSDNGSSVVPGAGLHHNLNLTQVENVNITDSRFDTSPFGSGIEILFGRNVTVTGCEMSRNRLSGIRCSESENIVVERSLTEGNDLDGITIESRMNGCKRVNLRDNLTQSNGRYGIYTGNVAQLNESGNTSRFNRLGLHLDTKPAPDPQSPDYAAYPLEEWEKPFAGFSFGVYRKNDFTLPYRFHSPKEMDKQKKYPLVLFMHGAGERGIDNRYQFFRFKPVPFWEQEECFVLAPQCPTREYTAGNADCVWVDTPFGAPAHSMKASPTRPMQLTIELLDSLLQLPQIDKSRIYVTGLSMGGFATWELIQRFPEKFAAAAPVCGGGDPAYAASLTRLPVWAFHGDADDTVIPERSREMVDAIKKAGGKPLYTEYKGVGHGAWSPAYSNPDVWKWMFTQKK
jgi:poly(3-hydroxybutyrate) depolymerase